MSVSRRAVRKSLRMNFTPGAIDYARRGALRLRQAAHLPALVASGGLDRPIFIIGAPRSGNSLLYAILRTSPRVAHFPGESHEIWEVDYHPMLRGWDSNVLDESDVEPRAAARIRRALLLVAGTRKRLVDKTPRNSLRVPFVNALFPDARFVFLKRDGRDNVNSLMNAWRSPRYRTYALPEPHSVPGCDPKWWKFVLYPGWRDDVAGPLEVVCAKQWKTSNEHSMAAAHRIDPDRWFEVTYEELTDRPIDVVGRLLDFVDLPYTEEVREHAADLARRPINVVTPPERGKWRRENPDAIASILPLIEPTMKAMGYRIDED